MLIVDATSARVMLPVGSPARWWWTKVASGSITLEEQMSFVWARKRDTGRFRVVRQVTIDDEALEKIADILGIPTAHRTPGTMYIATKKPPPPPPNRVSRQSK